MALASMSSGEKGYDDDIFEIEDFTIVTINEGLCAELEQLLRKWELIGDNGNNYTFTKVALAECQWDSKYDKVTYGNNHLFVTHYWPKNLQRSEQTTKLDVLNADASDSFLSNAARLFWSSETDFCPGSIICNQFGVLEFILLTPSDWHLDKVSNEDQLRGLLSSITESTGKAGCALPIFVQYGERERQLYFGICQNNSMRTNFESVHQRRGHPLRCHLSGCLDIFRETLQSSLMDEGNLRISMQFDYILQDKPCYALPQKNMVIEEELVPAKNEGIIDISHLPFGAATDAIEEFGLSAIWSNIERGVAVEEQNLSNLDPQRALAWSAWVSIQKNASYLMSSCLRKLLEAAESQEGSSLVRKREHSKQDASRALSSLLSPTVPENISIRSTNRVTSRNDLEPDIIRHWVDKVFEKTKCEHVLPGCNTSCTVDVESVCSGGASSPGPGSAVKNVQCSKAYHTESIKEDSNTMDIYQKLSNILSACKSAPESSLTCRISVALAQMLCAPNHSLAGFSHLWSAITYELQEYYEKNLYVPGLDESLAPNLSTCKLHQNLQLLQCAIEAKKRRESKNLFMQNWQLYKSEGDEFFDAPESLEESGEGISRQKPDSSGAEGRLKTFSTLRLFHFPDRLMYEPVTQSRVPITEDMLERHAEYLASLKNPEERVKAQLEPLFSDMEAFKAANPGCCFEDFVRWHSPRDFIVDDENTGKGHLSSRMTGEDNTWQLTWNQAQPKPACRQKMLFDDVKAANKIISDFENLTVSKLIVYILPVLFKCASAQLVDESKPYFALTGDKLVNLCKKVSNCTRSNDLDDYLDAVKDIIQIEGVVACCNALYTQLVSAIDKRLTENEKCEIRQFVMLLVRSDEQNCQSAANGGKAGAGYRVPIVRGLCGPVGLALKNLFLVLL
ncbi:Rab3 GTPase-activating protein catalytic subunit [Loa loa]|uniref:Rab3 GTPase-activating protein catalytic subunit n=1 Tax=Loa loa TaxID=7209 RepID=A0A1S0UIX6_LOALO|nr:Rab3 GTPase-activating protein catalytic subunit [Loa loa]EJD75539.1 Rab3 GTPase-activating protein catalytic subunit [Loa loa]